MGALQLKKKKKSQKMINSNDGFIGVLPNTVAGFQYFFSLQFNLEFMIVLCEKKIPLL